MELKKEARTKEELYSGQIDSLMQQDICSLHADKWLSDCYAHLLIAILPLSAG